MLLVGFDTLTYRKDYDRSPTLVGHQDSFLAPLPGSEAPLVGGILRGLFGVSSPRPVEQRVAPQPTELYENIYFEIPSGMIEKL